MASLQQEKSVMTFVYVKCLGCGHNVRMNETIELRDQNQQLIGHIHAHPPANRVFDNPCRARALGLSANVRRPSSPHRPMFASV